ncbi:HNH endonuclease signature motif containing protein [Tessaracoccus sp.]
MDTTADTRVWPTPDEVRLQGEAREAAWHRGVARLGELSSQLAQVHAAMVAETAHLIDSSGWAGVGVRSVEHFLQVFGWLSPAHAHQVAAVARRRTEVPEAVLLMEEGRLSLDQAVVVAQHAPAEFSRGAAELAEKMTVAQLRRTLSRYAFQITTGEPEEEVPEGEPESELSMSSSGGRFRLRFETSADEGALVEQAIREAKDALFTAGNEKASLADGLLEMASRSLEAVNNAGRREHYRVLIHLDVAGRGWLGKKGALPEALLRHATCEGKVVPVWEKDGSPVAVGRSQRIVPGRTRRLVEDRDRGCRFPGCAVTGFLENHHLVHWADGGPTDPENLVSLCPFHHREHHTGVFTMTGTPVAPDGLVFTSRHGYAIAPVKPWPPPAPPDPTPPNTEILRGDTCQGAWLEIPPNTRPSHPPGADPDDTDKPWQRCVSPPPEEPPCRDAA